MFKIFCCGGDVALRTATVFGIRQVEPCGSKILFAEYDLAYESVIHSIARRAESQASKWSAAVGLFQHQPREPLGGSKGFDLDWISGTILGLLHVGGLNKMFGV